MFAFNGNPLTSVIGNNIRFVSKSATLGAIRKRLPNWSVESRGKISADGR